MTQFHTVDLSALSDNDVWLFVFGRVHLQMNFQSWRKQGKLRRLILILGTSAKNFLEHIIITPSSALSFIRLVSSEPPS